MNRTARTARPAAGPVARIAADSRPVLIVTVITTAAVALASFALSFSALRDAALWGRVPESLAFLVPVVIDASVLVYGLGALVLKARGRSSAWAWTLMLLFTVVSIGANGAHAYDVGPELRTVVGVVLATIAPLSVLTSTHALASLVVVAVRTPTPDPDPEPEPVTLPVAVAEAAGVREVAAAEPVPAIEAPAADPEPAPAPEPAPVPAPMAEPRPAESPSAPPAPVLGPVRSTRARTTRAPLAMQSTLPGLDLPGVTA